MAVPRRVIDIAIEADYLMQLERITRSRTEPTSWVERARILLAYRADPSAHAVGEMVGVTHQSVLRCLRRAVRFGVMAALDDSPRPGKAPEITADARAWLLSLACQKAKDLGYPQELWTTQLLASHVREHARSRFCAPRMPRQVMSQSSPMTRSRASRRLTPPPPTCRRSPRFMRPSHATMNTNVMAH